MNTSPGILSYTGAAELIQAHAAGLSATNAETIPLAAALGRVLTVPIIADRNQPPFDRSTRDGFACRADDLTGAIRIIGQVRAGEAWQGAPLGQQEAVEIMTGAPVPPGADCVVMVEHVIEADGSFQLQPGRSMKAGDNIVPDGAEAVRGSIVAPQGVRLAAPQIAAAASCGYGQVNVFCRPRIAILSTGDELVELGAIPLPHQIRNSNSYTLAALVSSAGAEPMVLPPARDEHASLKTAMDIAFTSNLVLLSGGVSMGKYDLVEEVLAGLGAEFFFTGVEIQPGRPAVFGRVAGKYFFGLPGNPVSTMVTFLLFAAPLVRALSGEEQHRPRFLQATLSRSLDVKPGLTRFLPAVVDFDIERPQVQVIDWQGSGDLAATSRANCFLVVPPERNTVGAGEVVSLMVI